MANLGISKASIFAESKITKLQSSVGGSMKKLASSQNSSSGDKASFSSMSNRLSLDVAATKASVKGMSVAQGYLATAMDALDNASLMLAKLQELTVLGANSTNSVDDAAAIDAEAEAIAYRFHELIQNAQYKGLSVFSNADSSGKLATGNSSALSFGIAELEYDDLFDHTNPLLHKTEPEKTYKITSALTDLEKSAILQHTNGLTADDLVVGAEFTTIAAAPPGPPPADNVLLIARNDQPQSITNVKSRLEAAGHNVTVRQQHLDIQDVNAPADAANFDQI